MFEAVIYDCLGGTYKFCSHDFRWVFNQSISFAKRVYIYMMII